MEDLKEKFKYAKAFAEADESAERHSRTIFEFNKMLRSGKSSLECYQWLQAEKDKEEYEWQKKHGFPMHLDFYYLYPEVIGPMPDTYEEWKEELKKYSKDSSSLRDKLIKKYGEDKVLKLEEEISKHTNKKFTF